MRKINIASNMIESIVLRTESLSAEAKLNILGILRSKNDPRKLLRAVWRGYYDTPEETGVEDDYLELGDEMVTLRVTPVVYYKLQAAIKELAEDPNDPRCEVCDGPVDKPGGTHDCPYLNKE
jgi:hypothetical protein